MPTEMMNARGMNVFMLWIFAMFWLVKILFASFLSVTVIVSLFFSSFSYSLNRRDAHFGEDLSGHYFVYVVFFHNKVVFCSVVFVRV